MFDKKALKDVVGFTGLGVATGVGASVATAAGSSQAAAGLGNMASFYPAAGSIIGGGLVLRQLRKLGERP